MTTRRDEDPATGRPDHPRWSPDGEGDDAPQPLPPAPGATRAERRRAQEAAEAAARRPFADAFTESPSGTGWPRPSFDGPPPTTHGQDPDSARPGATRPDTDGPAPAGGVGGDSDGPRTDAYGIRIDAYGAGTGAGGPTGARAPGEPGEPGEPERGPVPPPRDGWVPLPDRQPGEPVPPRDGRVPLPDRQLGEPVPPRDGWVPLPDRQVGEPVPPRDGPVPLPERQPGEPVPGDARLTGAFDPGNTGTWRVRDVVPGADGGRRTTVILRYLLGVLAIDHVRSLSRWAFALPVVGLVLLVVRPRWIGLAVIVLGVLLIVGRIVAVRMISRHTLPRRYRPVEDELRAAVEAGKANLRGEMRRVGMPTSGLALTRSVVRLGSSDSRRTARSRLRDIEIDRVLPRAQLDRALRVLDEAPTPR